MKQFNYQLLFRGLLFAMFPVVMIAILLGKETTRGVIAVLLIMGGLASLAFLVSSASLVEKGDARPVGTIVFCVAVTACCFYQAIRALLT